MITIFYECLMCWHFTVKGVNLSLKYFDQQLLLLHAKRARMNRQVSKVIS